MLSAGGASTEKALSPIHRCVRGTTRLPHDEACSVDWPEMMWDEWRLQVQSASDPSWYINQSLRSTQSGHPSAGRCNQYRRKLGNKQGHASRKIHQPSICGLAVKMVSGWRLSKGRSLPLCGPTWHGSREGLYTKSSATAKSTARPLCLVGVLRHLLRDNQQITALRMYRCIFNHFYVIGPKS